MDAERRREKGSIRLADSSRSMSGIIWICCSAAQLSAHTIYKISPVTVRRNVMLFEPNPIRFMAPHRNGAI